MPSYASRDSDSESANMTLSPFGLKMHISSSCKSRKKFRKCNVRTASDQGYYSGLDHSFGKFQKLNMDYYRQAKDTAEYVSDYERKLISCYTKSIEENSTTTFNTITIPKAPVLIGRNVKKLHMASCLPKLSISKTKSPIFNYSEEKRVSMIIRMKDEGRKISPFCVTKAKVHKKIRQSLKIVD